MMHRLAAHLTVAARQALDTARGRSRAGDRRRADAGLSTLEYVILVLGVISLATLAVTVISQAVQTRISQIR